MRYMKQRPDKIRPVVWMGFMTAMLSVVVSGCTAGHPQRFTDGVNQITVTHKSRDAKAQFVKGWPGLRIDAAIRQQLDTALSSDDPAVAKAQALAFLESAHELAARTTINELDRLSDAGWEELIGAYFVTALSQDEQTRQMAKNQFIRDADSGYGNLRRRVTAAQQVREVREVLSPLAKRIEKPVKLQGKAGRAISWAIFAIPSTLAILNIHSNEYRGDLDEPFDSAVRYLPDLADTTPPDGMSKREWGLLTAFAPVIVQERPGTVSYERSVDSLGRVVAPDENTIEIDPSNPTVYAYTRHIRITDRPHTQLTYTYWYPRHPELKSNDPEAGHTEGLTLRVTLDQRDEPIAFETLYNCGCYHRLYPSSDLEAAAMRSFGKPAKGKRFAIERRVPWKFDTIVPKVVQMKGRGDRPVVRNRAGWHGIINVAMDEQGHEHEAVDQIGYTLRPYDELEQLTTPDGRIVSMFYDNGLVKGAQRLEGVFFTPAGLLSSGQPRQRGTQMIHWDHYDFDDPDLLKHLLRLPDPSNPQSAAKWTGQP